MLPWKRFWCLTGKVLSLKSDSISQYSGYNLSRGRSKVEKWILFYIQGKEQGLGGKFQFSKRIRGWSLRITWACENVLSNIPRRRGLWNIYWSQTGVFTEYKRKILLHPWYHINSGNNSSFWESLKNMIKIVSLLLRGKICVPTYRNYYIKNWYIKISIDLTFTTILRCRSMSSREVK